MHIAYQVIGDGPIDLVLFGTFVSHCDLGWENPSVARFFQRLASSGITFEDRGLQHLKGVGGTWRFFVATS